ncbi:hypothetical protein [Cupriavidus alkaliphilus]|uniref:hypothetical protein n=1 Tax=Cupriavidus alkaliphilus TaxID=942866 RepID=UPI000DC494AE|nr:hypothetical protein [Cupriavidus alkaliphilus]MBB2918383.1 hypothetical protein [Cupriavidus alkaliphilus]MBB3014223.1 hypothetical protein [Cupriavidus alkaliphilus]PVY69261.1 hypothetical protein C7414_11943 [Cupriavidus alkaliphilus]RAR99320.1 hypothetical protein C7415_12043 [Cupriavidus alkaliphilus]
MKFHALLLAASMAAGWTSFAQAAGCQYDMQCKGERICHHGQCVYPEVEESAEAGGPPKAGAAAAAAAPAAEVTPVPTTSVAPIAPATITGTTAGTTAGTTVKRSPNPPPPRGCCTVAGKLKLSPASASDTSLASGDACQGLTASGKPVPGTICN